MALSCVAAATRAFVAVLLLLARRYELVLEVNRDSSPERVVKAYRKLLLKTHPDEGGRKEDAQNLQAAREKWESARKGSSGKAGRPSASGNQETVACHDPVGAHCERMFRNSKATSAKQPWPAGVRTQLRKITTACQ